MFAVTQGRCTRPAFLYTQSRGTLFCHLEEPRAGTVIKGHTLRIPRIHSPHSLVTGKQLTITGQPAHHVTRVLRLRTGALMRVFDGQGCEHQATIAEIKRSVITLEIGEPVTVIPESHLQLTLLQGIARNDRMDFILQKAVELGVQAIQPVWMERSQTRLKGERLEKRINHWQGVIVSACEQCGRATLPQLLLPEDYPSRINAGTDSDLCLMLQPGARSCLRDLKKPAGSIYILIGPEGGLTPGEQAFASSTGFTGISMGPRILRTETAAITALAGIQTLWGDLR